MCNRDRNALSFHSEMQWLGYMETRVRRNTRPMRYWGTPWGEGLTGALHTDPHQADSIRKLRLSILGQTLWVCRAKLRENTERDRGRTTLAAGLVVIGSSANLTFPFRALLSSACPLLPPPPPRVPLSTLASGPPNNWSPISRRNVTINLTRNLISIISVYLQAMSFGFFFFFFLWSSSDVLDDPIIDYRFYLLLFYSFFFLTRRNEIKERFPI